MKHPTARQPAVQEPGAHGTQGACCTRRAILRSIPAYAAVTLTLPATLGLLAGCDGKGKSFQVRGGEKRPVLNPYRFSDPRVQFTYAAAQKHPQVLDKLYCYCHCSRAPFNHKSLLSCFATTHGAGWLICLEQARWAVKWSEDGKAIDEIRRLNDSRFG